jgi:phenylpropionate dioxygenase-like ring-hydroxylating dioxygenase large terminal subunit
VATAPPTTQAAESDIQHLRAELAALQDLSRDRARAMPGAYYTSAAYLALEREELFRKQWICVGHIGAVPTAGDYFTSELIDEPLLIVRESPGSIRVMSNVCRHRGNLVALGSGHRMRHVCGYHGWSYALDGQLLSAPLIENGPHFEKKGCRLPTFASAIWQGFIFVNLDGQAAPLGPSLSAIEPSIRNYHPAQQHWLFETEELWKTNWKCLVENFMEGYHLSALHAKTLHPITPTALCRKLGHGAGFTGYRANFHPECPERGPYHPDLTEVERRSDVFYCIYPSFVVGFCPHFTLYMCVSPLTTDTLQVRWGVLGIADDPQAPVVKDYVRFCKEFCEEDRATLESLQRGLQSHTYVPGPLAPDDFEGTLWDIYQYMARKLGAHEKE